MDWDHYAPTVKTRIERLAKRKDCAGLQGEFDNADSNGNDAELMEYLDALMRRAGCY